jgi:hypothetical protein
MKAAKALKPDARLCLSRAGGREWLLDVRGFPSEIDAAIGALAKTLGAEARSIGSYATPFGAGCL